MLVGPLAGDVVPGPDEEPVGCRASEVPVTAGVLLEVC